MIAVDSSVLIDLLGDAPGADAAEAALRLALSSGPVVLCDVVLTEVTAGLGHGSEVMDALEEMGLRFLAIDQRAAIRAGEMQRKFKQRLAEKAAGKTATGASESGSKAMPDFLVGAHAMLQCEGLITRDQGFFRDYFKGLKVIVPSAP
ncbi:MAG: type II toxin-antitoxin system VapC family toxin [Mitsuaria chitosanitabida]|jgi:predicted nucleic acid-binding protein|uniref:type II toxin-antitoxin system VapC family toxin n=1 Tax=Roseateles chitosanitabidus TaxID=65048 RepID=UPI001B00636F|nr:type II toxin-antitoxin system VapC family toxin [Roseateles chitosanitabidus]MBO9685429.1 type II toxin-antitoxin system VapC family toxin [Roseateles chitosanitabidus]